MNNKKVIARIKSYVTEKEQKSLIRQCAKNELEEIHKANNNSRTITQSEIDNYIDNHYDNLKEKTDVIIDDLVSELTKESRAYDLLKDIGILCLIMIPPMYPICEYITLLVNQSNNLSISDMVNIAVAMVSLIILIIPIVGYFASLFYHRK